MDAERLQAARAEFEDVIMDYAHAYELPKYRRRTNWSDVEKAIADYSLEVERLRIEQEWAQA